MVFTSKPDLLQAVRNQSDLLLFEQGVEILDVPDLTRLGDAVALSLKAALSVEL